MNNSQKIHLSFTIGPVQGFVAQARRTRDLWAGSWLLSYLAESALAAAEKAGGTAIIPFRKEEEKGKITSTGTAIGGIPNRFEVQFDTEDQAKKAAEAATDAFKEAWKKVAGAVYKKFVQPVECKGKETKVIWDRQVKKFWEISWVVGEIEGRESKPKTLTQLSAARKNIRNVNATSEDGTKCSLMGTLQEISGFTRSKEQDTFWETVREKDGNLDIKKGERLCAIALIKRLFPKVTEKAIDEKASKKLEQVAWPSTAFLAALPWLKELKDDALKDAKKHSNSVKGAGYNKSESNAVKEIEGLESWAGIDAPVWFTSAILQDEPGKEKLGSNPSKEKIEERKREVQTLRDQLKEVYEKAGSLKENRKPIPYYALLLMDGDSMGKLVGTLKDPSKVSEGLSKFSNQVEGIVENSDGRNGRTIYAGGDDVLAILPAKDALQVADTLSKKYSESFKGSEQATLSGAIVYAHWKYPLRQVLQTAHRLLDDIAKEKTGRDALAIGIIQGSGLQAVWSAPWKVIRGEVEDEGFGKLDEIIDRFGISLDKEAKDTEKGNTEKEIEFNASYLYLLREQFSKLFAKPIEAPGEFGNIDIGEDLLVAIANSENRRRMTKGERENVLPCKTIEKVKPLIALSHQWTRNENTKKITANKKTFSFDGWRVARFLKQVKEGKIDGHE